MLSDKDIKAALAAGTIAVGPIEDPDIQIQPASIDLRLGNDFRVFKHTQRAYIDPLRDDMDEYTEIIHVEDGEAFILHPGEFVLGTIKEYVKIPDDIVAQVDGRSSLGRLAILVHATAGFIDPGFEGNITLELSNVGKMPVAFYPNMRVCQISFTPLSSPSDIPYGHPSRRSKYQGQRGPTASRIGRDAGRSTPNAPMAPSAPTAPGGSGEPGGSGAPGGSGVPSGSGAPGGSGVPSGSGAPGGSGVPSGSGAPGAPGAPTAPRPSRVTDEPVRDRAEDALP